MAYDSWLDALHDDSDGRESAPSRPPPGRVTLTQRLPASTSYIARAVADGVAAALGGAEAAVARARDGLGAPLPDETRDRFARALGADLGGVRVHTDGAATAAAAAIGARAFTIGPDIYFGQGQYDPSGSDGKLLLAHEVVHTVQQAGGARTGEIQHKLELSEPGDALEQEADRLAPDVVAGLPAVVHGSGAATARAIMRWASSPPDAVQARLYIQGAIQSARTREEVAGILAALEAPNSSDGRVTVHLPDDAPVSIVDLDLPPLLDEARARQRALGGPSTAGPREPMGPPAPGGECAPREGDAPRDGAPREGDAPRSSRSAPVPEAEGADVEADTADVRLAIRYATTLAQIDQIRATLDMATHDRAGDVVPVALDTGRESRNAWVARSEIPALRAEADRRRAELVEQDAAEAQDASVRRAWDAERADERTRADDERARVEDSRRQLEDQQAAEAADRDARGLAIVRAALAAHSDSLTRERIRDILRASTAERSVFRPELPDGRRPELNAEDRAQAITLAEQAVTEARSAERAAGECRAPEGDTSSGTPEQRADLIRQIGDTLVECGGAFDSAAQAMADDLRSAASGSRDIAKLIFKVAFAITSSYHQAASLAVKAAIAAVGAVGEYNAGEQAAHVAGARDDASFLAALQDGERRGRQAISADLNCHTTDELRAIRANYQAIIAAGQGYYTSRLRTLVYNHHNQVGEIGRRHDRALDTTETGVLAWIERDGDAYLAVVHRQIDGLAPIASYHFHSWVFRQMAPAALARQPDVLELAMDDIEHWYEASPPAPPSYAYRRGDPLPEDVTPPVR
jgi:hypothetical protein